MSNRTKLKLKEFAKHLLAQETRRGKTAGGAGPAVFRVCEKLRGSLGKLMGVTGYRSLFSRALALAGAEVPWLRELTVRADGTLEGLEKLKSKLSGEQVGEGEVALVAELVGLIVTFIGPTLTLQLIQQAWPKADFSKCKL